MGKASRSKKNYTYEMNKNDVIFKGLTSKSFSPGGLHLSPKYLNVSRIYGKSPGFVTYDDYFKQDAETTVTHTFSSPSGHIYRLNPTSVLLTQTTDYRAWLTKQLETHRATAEMFNALVQDKYISTIECPCAYRDERCYGRILKELREAMWLLSS